MLRWRGLVLAACGLWITSSAAHGTIAFRSANDVRVGAGPTAVAYVDLGGPRLIVGRDAGLALVGPLDSDFPVTSRIGSVQFIKSVIVGAFTASGSTDIACIAGTDPAVSILKHAGQIDFGRATPVALPARPLRLRSAGAGRDGMAGIFASHDAGVSFLEPLGGGRFTIQTVSTHPFPTEFDVGDINGDGLADFVTGKRWWAHGPKGDINPGDPAVLFWFELQREGGKPAWIPHQIDHDSGVGTQIEVADVNGDKLLDIVTSNKKGVHYFEQIRQP
jgi:hypothetical protein